ncbi:3'-5' exonuclease domain-containing protein 2 [Desulfovibrio aminophilus]|nr:3'-5' exonuclease [Desulfovibrio aminophilus]MCM0753872.1 3'-5' exonuclease domain-containing protein 2 [Desulfovibrio aminophilus]
MTPTPSLPEHHLRAFGNEEINVLPLRHYEGGVTVVRTDKQLKAALKALEGEELLGFDTETRPVFRKGQGPYPPALVQLASADHVYLFQISVLTFGDGLKDLLAAPSVIKTGVSVTDDVKALKDLSPFQEAGFLDLGTLSAKLQMKTHGLRNLAANLLGFRISKSAQCSNWARENLSRSQILYAATDAWISREIYLAFRDLGVLPERP